jgi:predicted nucleic acid-binding protein
MVRVADTSALYALLNESDPHHTDARAAFEDPDPILMPTEILAETIQMVHYRKGPDAGRRVLEAVFALPQARIADPVDVAAVRQVYKDGKGRLSIFDAFVIQTCRQHAAAALTFDDDIRRALKP